jgi:hypothetical protein
VAGQPGETDSRKFDDRHPGDREKSKKKFKKTKKFKSTIQKRRGP